ncbi:MAG TPA: ferritin-like domain-containing protein [Trueperaceae bacterium]|nr:ferritin-like domain-containing protein [Trueperaceae bacterium]
MQLTNLKDVLVHELKDLYSAEKQLIEALPRVAKAASSAKLKNAIEKHLEVTKKQLTRIEEAGKSIGATVTGHTCEGMKGLVKEADGLIKENEKSEALDAALISAAQRIEHYEIAAYGSAVEFAKELGHNDVASMLQKTLDEEGKADKELTAIAESSVNERAVA